MKIVILDGYCINPGDLSWSEFEKLGDVTVYDRTPYTDEKECISRIGDADVVFTSKIRMTENVINGCPNLKFIGVFATGYNAIDIVAAKKRGIVVTNVPTYGTNVVGQFAIALLLEICNRVGHHSEAVHQGRWQTSKDWSFWDYPLIDLSGKTMGIIGFGRIGQATGRIAKALEMNVIANDAYESDAGREIATYVSMEELYAKSDVISLHCPLLPETTGIINKDNIAKMKDGVIIINNSRGRLVVDEDLADALGSGKVYAAGLDVISKEPINDDNPLLKAKNCYITPHIAWAPKESRARLLDISANNLKSFIEGNPTNVVNA